MLSSHDSTEDPAGYSETLPSATEDATDKEENQPSITDTSIELPIENIGHNDHVLNSVDNTSDNDLNANVEENDITFAVTEHDGNTKWVPAQTLKKTNALLWTHYLGIDGALNIVKCKHCNTILKRGPHDAAKNSTVNFRMHLKTAHKVTPNMSFYDEENILDNNVTKNLHSRESTLDDVSSTFDSQLFKRRKYIKKPKTLPPFTLDMSKEITKLKPRDVPSETTIKTRQHFFPSNNLLAIVVASENLPLDFANNSALKLLMSSILTSLPTSPDSIRENIIGMATSINKMIRKSSIQNDYHLPFELDISHLRNDLIGTERKLLLCTLIMNGLKDLPSFNFYSLSHQIWNQQYSLISIQFIDYVNSKLRILPISIEDMGNKPITPKLLNRQLYNVISKYPGLTNSLLSISAPRKICDTLKSADPIPNEFGKRGYDHTENSVIHNYDDGEEEEEHAEQEIINSVIENAIQNLHYQPCIVSALEDCVTVFFGLPSTNIYEEQISKSDMVSTLRNKDDTALDSLIDLNRLDISLSIFEKISSFYEEINNDSWQMERFQATYSDIFGNNNNNNNNNNDDDDDGENDILNQTKNPFNKKFYSSSIHCLKRFLRLRPLIENMTPFLQNEIFSDLDFQIMKSTLLTLQSLNKLILLHYVSPSDFNFINIIPTILTIEAHINQQLEISKYNRYKRPFLLVQNLIKSIKDRLLLNDTNLLGSFLSPIIVSNESRLKTVFGTTDTGKIIKRVSNIAMKIVMKYVHVPDEEKLMEKGENGTHDESETEHEPEPFLQLAFGTIGRSSEKSPKTRLIDDVQECCQQLFERLFLAFLRNVQSEYPKGRKIFCEKNGYIPTNDGQYRKVNASGGANDYDDNDALGYEDSFSNALNDEDVHTGSQNILDPIEELLTIHLPLCDIFWNQYLMYNTDPLFTIILNIVRSISSTSKRSEYAFLKNYRANISGSILEETIKVAVFDKQCAIGKVDFNSDTLTSLGNYI
ncbi:zinc finger BED domain-containing protein NDAI_0D04520 [Naumovozyma dairenensis CBS 421]|uniref:BED-type domain-containing protein n=1 Tax=Naumovozyma dairenensis (strain ATCC 10597 / BCRC 20456 / CBS 421 / NBRC 0211 / NRRL Y-12639) TaxID=1071378 RepID=G0WAF5_NAUDC|nr:hypothetical protein NDAI_0D04520 [Naumovozyma dairenensis CBS 421]CCD24766.1 hypothetical protein NDAI_0D04520 [Naumovozyma dairenensis CBS 421]